MSTRQRCAIYTRKSTEEGLDQDFNSLQAQREACEAYIASQASLGWSLVPTPFDDGGISGGTMERPGLQALLAGIAAGRIDVVVVYKIDRLTRSLMDFARMVEIFDRHKVSFVSVTQQFNTTTSMGRLTLNVLLSFAQFEREVTAERIRDKIAASKRKGMWMGGRVPLGYRAEDRKLVVDEAEAATVRRIFELYREHGTVRKALKAMAEEGLTSKSGALPSAGHVYKILSNPLYIGRVAHKGKIFEGQHAAIVPKPLWQAVQDSLSVDPPKPTAKTAAVRTVPHLLAGLVFDDQGDRLATTHTSKGGRRYAYYVSRRLTLGNGQADGGWRLPAAELDAAVLGILVTRFSSAGDVLDLCASCGIPTGSGQSLITAAAEWAARLKSAPATEQRHVLQSLLQRVEVVDGAIILQIAQQGVLALLRPNGSSDSQADDTLQPCIISVPQSLARRGVETRLVLPNEASMPQRRDPALIALIAQATVWADALTSGRATSISELAAQSGLEPNLISRTVALGFLAPDIVEAILNGRQPAHLTTSDLRRVDLPMDWAEQRRLLGFESAVLMSTPARRAA